MANRYTRALKQIKDATLDEKLKLLEDLPTNNTTGIFVDTPGQYQPQEILPGDIDSPLNLEQDGDGSPTYDGRDTSGLFQADGTIRSVEPPGDTSYVLGPMSSMYYGWGGFTQIGYIRQSDRKMVNLARITGTIEGWDGESNFTSYGQLTLEQAVWFRDQSKSDYQAFYPGPPSGGSDDYGRYLSQIVDTGKSVVEIIRAIFTPGTNKGFDPSDVFSSILGLLLGTDDSILTDFFSNSALGTQGLVFLGYLTNQLPDVIGNEFLGQNYVNDSFANMKLGYDQNGKPISSVGDNVIGSGQYPTYNPATNEIELNFNYDFKSNVEEFKGKEGLLGGLAGEFQKGVYNALGPYSVDAQVGPSFVGPITGGIFGTLIQHSKTLGGGKPTPGKITISPQQLQQINPEAYNQLVNSGNVPSDAVDKPSQNKQVPADGAEIDPEKAIESLKNSLPADQRAQLDFQQTMSMDNFNKLSKSDQNKVMNALQDRHKSRSDGSNFQDAPKYMKDRFKASAKEAGKTKFKDGYMIDKDPNTGKTRKTPIFSTIPGMSSVLVMGNEPSGKLLTESQKRALRNVKKPVKVKEIPTKVKVKPTSRKNKTVGVDMMKVPDTPKEYKPQIDIWSKEDYAANVRASQEKKNHVLEMLGAAEHHWSYLTEEKRRKKQERVNEELAAKYDREMEDLYERYKARQDKVDKTISSFKKPADIAPEYPKDPPPQMVNGYHPKYGKQYKHDKLDPQSAEAMPPTGNPEVDANIKKATNTKEKQRKTNILYKSFKENTYWNRLQKWRYCGAVLNEGMTSSGMFITTTLEPTGDNILTDVSTSDLRYNIGDAVVADGAIRFGEVKPHGYDTTYWYQAAGTVYIQAAPEVGTQNSTHVTFNVDVGTGLDAPLPQHPLKVNYQMTFTYQGQQYNAGSGTLGTISSSGLHSFELPEFAEFYDISFDLRVDGTFNKSYEADYQRRQFVGTTIYGMTVTEDDTINSLAPGRMLRQILDHPGPFNDDASTTVSVFLSHTRTNGLTVYQSMNTMPSGETGGHTGSDREYLYNLIRSQYAHLKDKYAKTYTVTSAGLTRRTPLTVFVPLDDPDSASFVRDGNFDRLTPAEKKKKLEEQLRASEEYLNKMFGEGMPGGATELSDIQPQKSFSDIAASYPKRDPLDKLLKDIDDADKKIPPANDPLPPNRRGMGDRWKGAQGDSDTQVASARGPYGTPGADKPYTRQGYKDKDGKFVDFDNPATWPSIVPKPPRAGKKQTTMVAHHEPQGEVISEKKRLKSPKSLADKIPGYYDGKPSPLGFPIEEPPKMKNGYHPDLVDGKKVSQRYNRLDPISARAMPKTGNPHIDKKVKAAAAKGKDKTFKEFWVPITGNGPTNSASQTFAFGDPESGIEYTVNGLGGQTYPSGTEVFGDPVSTPEYSQLAMQGYTPPLGNEVMKRDKQDENLKKIKDTLKKLGTSWEEMRANNWAIVRPDGTSIVLEPIEPGRGQLNWIDNSKITVGRKHRDAEPDQNPYKITNPDGSITMEFSEIVSVTEFRVGDELNKQLDASEKFTKEIDADEFMKGRVTDTTKPAPKFGDDITDPNNPDYNKRFAPITAGDEYTIDMLDQTYGKLTTLYPDLRWTQKLAIDYAKGNLSPRKVSPGKTYNAGVLKAIEHNLGVEGVALGDVSTYNHMNPLDIAKTATTRLSMGRFNYKATTDGLNVTDFFNFDGNLNLGVFGEVSGLNNVAKTLVDLGQRRAAQKGYKMVHTVKNIKTGKTVELAISPDSPNSPDGYGIDINFTIPWSEVSPELQNKLDPTATIIPTTKRAKRKNRRGRVTESTWNKLNRHIRS